MLNFNYFLRHTLRTSIFANLYVYCMHITATEKNSIVLIYHWLIMQMVLLYIILYKDPNGESLEDTMTSTQRPQEASPMQHLTWAH